jgi:hypothetical protein
MNLGDLQSVVAAVGPIIRAQIDKELGGILGRLDRIEVHLGKKKAEVKRDGDARF